MAAKTTFANDIAAAIAAAKDSQDSKNLCANLTNLKNLAKFANLCAQTLFRNRNRRK
ncbi:MAG: hypothetical protein K8L97_03315 [Anaerolineae bacterium]|nr:hypothetical protein [Anaerolineae bacterium]